ncbi:MAG: hypothetical protein ACREUG_14425 [Steroidobacteraceae bacterium]
MSSTVPVPEQAGSRSASGTASALLGVTVLYGLGLIAGGGSP